MGLRRVAAVLHDFEHFVRPPCRWEWGGPIDGPIGALIGGVDVDQIKGVLSVQQPVHAQEQI